MQRPEGAHEEVRVANQFRICVIGGLTEVQCSMRANDAAGALLREAQQAHLVRSAELVFELSLLW